MTEAPITSIAHAIQLAVAPVFLLTGVAGILSVLTNRLGRIIDRSRTLRNSLPTSEAQLKQAIYAELTVLTKRIRCSHWAIGLCTACALLICSVIAVLFLGSFMSLNMRLPIAILFIVAMLCLIIALIGFLWEIYLATAHVRSDS